MPAMTDRLPPPVPNHEMVRVIGRGAYGEIWLARSLTGTWRAVKIVDRRNFESDKAFHREFEGMARFEPISRGDAGFVDILHVGRDPEGHFFYYVMELADDHLAGTKIDPETYEPRTLKAELARRSRLPVEECLTIALSLTRALGALHQQGLVHRDVKPANVIFVRGVPKIADIGLVAASGQISYVGTEGYVPPEGPGSPQADLYSLGKVLYEMAMGKDRLEFPAVNTRLAEFGDKAALLKLNEVLLRVCSPDPAERYESAEELHEDLQRLREGRPLPARKSRRRRFAPALAGALLLIAAAAALFMQLRSGRGSAAVETEPPGAMVVVGDRMKRSPARFTGLPAGEHRARVMLTGFDPVEAVLEVTPGEEPVPKRLVLERSRGHAEITSDPPGAKYEIRHGDIVVSAGKAPAQVRDLPTGQYNLRAKLGSRTTDEVLEIRRGETALHQVNFASGRVAISSIPPGAEVFLGGNLLGKAPLDLELPIGKHELIARYGDWPEQSRSIGVSEGEPVAAAFEFVHGSVKITSAPGGAAVFAGESEIGRTPLLLDEVVPGEVRYELRLTGFKTVEVSGARPAWAADLSCRTL
jgi:hypothetical protein